MLTSKAYFMEKLYPDLHKYLVGDLLGYYFAEKWFPGLDIRAFRNFTFVNKMNSDLSRRGYNYDEIDKMLTKEAKDKILSQPQKFLLFSVLDFVSFNNPMVPQRFFSGSTDAFFTFAEGRWPQIPAFVKIFLLLSLRAVWVVFFVFIIYGLIKNFKTWSAISWIFLII